MSLLDTPINETDAMKTVKGASLDKARDMLNTQLIDFMLSPDSFGPLLGKLRATQDPLELEIGRNAAMTNERAAQQSADQGFTMPQSAFWMVPDKDGKNGGGVATMIDKQIDVAEKDGLSSPANRKTLTERAYMHAVNLGTKTEHIREGALGMDQVFGGKEGERPEDLARGASDTMGLLSQARPAPTGEA